CVSSRAGLPPVSVLFPYTTLFRSICYGMQTMAAQLGGQVENSRVREFGYAEVRARGHSRLLEGIHDRVNGETHGLLDVWMSHGEDRKSTRLNSSHRTISYAVFCLK